MKFYSSIAFFLVSGILLASCSHDEPSAPNQNNINNPTPITLDMPGIGKVTYTLLKENGGRVSWYTGDAGHDKIAYDSRSKWYDLGNDVYDSRNDVYVMNSDGSNSECITCNNQNITERYEQIIQKRISQSDTRPGFFIGQPEWHPDGKHILIQVENLNSPHIYTNFMSFGQDQELWIINVEDKTAEIVLSHNETGNAFLHSRFSRSGRKIVFSARNYTVLNPDVGQNNIWDHWFIMVADFDINKSPSEMISSISWIKPNGRGFYETTGFIGDSETDFSYSFTGFDDTNNATPPFVDKGYTTDTTGVNTVSISDVPGKWDEKPRYSPSGNNIVIMSNRFDDSWDPTKGASQMTTELYLGPPGGTLNKLTDFKSFERYKDVRLLVTDHEWNKAGNKLVVLVQPTGDLGKYDADIWLLELPQSY